MLNLTRMEFRRLFRDKSVYITLASFLGFILIAMITMKLVTDQNLLSFATENGFEFTAEDQADAASFLSSTIADFVSNLLFSGGLMVCFSAIFCAVSTCDDFASGFGKNIFSYYPDRSYYIVSKIVTHCAINAMFILALTAASIILFKICGFPNHLGDPLKMVLMLLIGWVALIPLVAQNMLLCMLIRNAAVASILSILCGLGAVAGVLETIAGLFGIHVAQFFPPYLVMMSPYISGSSGTGSLLSFAVSQNGLGTNLLLSVFASLLWTLIYIWLSKKVLKKKDIC